MTEEIDYRYIICEQELLHASPVEVVEFLKNRAKKFIDKISYDSWLSSEGENYLYNLENFYIRMALASYSIDNIDIKRKIFENYPEGNVLRLCALSNDLYPFFPQAIFSEMFEEKTKTASWLLSAPNTELQAIFENKSVYISFWNDVLKRESPFDCVPDSKIMWSLIYIKNNIVANTNMIDGYLKFDSYKYEIKDFFDVLVGLLNKENISYEWAYTFSEILKVCARFKEFKIENPEEIILKWKSEEMEKKLNEENPNFLNPFQIIRKISAQIKIISDHDYLNFCFHSDDLALRLAAYRFAILSPSQLEAFVKKDKNCAVDSMIENPENWKNIELREKILDLLNEYGSNYSYNLYNYTNEVMKITHPKWFENNM